MTRARRPRSMPPLLRLLVLCLSTLLVGAATAGLLLSALRYALANLQAPGPGRPADALLLCVAAAGTLLVAWVALSLALSLLAALPGVGGALAARGATRLAPATVRRLAAALLGASLGATLSAGTAVATVTVSPATASAVGTRPTGLAPGDPAGGVPSAAWPLTPGGGSAPARTGAGPAAGTAEGSGSTDGTSVGAADGTAAGNGATVPDAAWTPPRPDRTPVPDPEALHLLSRAPEAGTLVDEDVVVRRGDTLWTIAARFLGPAATAEEVAREWPRWHEANRHAIGDDPDLIQPGQVLHPPTTTTGTP
jgi:resuscitation-promoting factor RpfA